MVAKPFFDEPANGREEAMIDEAIRAGLEEFHGALRASGRMATSDEHEKEIRRKLDAALAESDDESEEFNCPYYR